MVVEAELVEPEVVVELAVMAEEAVELLGDEELVALVVNTVEAVVVEIKDEADWLLELPDELRLVDVELLVEVLLDEDVLVKLLVDVGLLEELEVEAAVELVEDEELIVLIVDAVVVVVV